MKEGLIKKFDQWIFRQIELFKGNPQIAPLLAKLEQLPDAQQKIVHQVSTIILGFLPLMLFFIFFFQNVSIRSELSANEDLLEVINDITQKNNELSSLTRSLAGPTAYEDKVQFEQKLRSTLQSKGIDANAVRIENFASGSTTEEIASFEATLNFRKLSTSQFTSVIETFMTQDKLKIKSIDVIKNSENSTLAGNLQVQHIGRRGL